VTIRRLALLSVLAMVSLGAAVWANVSARPTSNDEKLAQALPVATAEATVDVLGPTPTTAPPSPTPLGAATLRRFAETEAPTWVEIPPELIVTPTPDAPTPVPLPFLTNIPPIPRDGGVLYLTFDDGPDPTYTNRILDILARYGAKATFFVLGSSVDGYPGVVQRIVAEGHALGNHTYRHEALPLETAERALQTLEATNAALARAVGRTTTCIRPPYGALDRAGYDLLTANGYTVHMWDVDSEDYRINDPYQIASKVLSSASLGDRVLLHDGPSNRAATALALESILDVLTTRGVQFHALPC